MTDILTNKLTNQPTNSIGTVIPKKLTVFQLVKKFPEFKEPKF